MCDHFYGELRKITREGGGGGRHFKLILLVQPLTRSDSTPTSKTFLFGLQEEKL